VGVHDSCILVPGTGGTGGNSAHTGAVLRPAGVGPPANYKNWNGDLFFVQLEWSKRPDGGWHLLSNVAPRQLSGHGVFVIWRNGSGVKVSAVLYVGRGFLPDEFARCLHDPIFNAVGLYVTWAAVDDTRMLDSVATYLYQRLRPLWGEAVFAPSMPVNLPLSA
jgi:hypothetical protein